MFGAVIDNLVTFSSTAIVSLYWGLTPCVPFLEKHTCYSRVRLKINWYNFWPILHIQEFMNFATWAIMCYVGTKCNIITIIINTIVITSTVWWWFRPPTRCYTKCNLWPDLLFTRQIVRDSRPLLSSSCWGRHSLNFLSETASCVEMCMQLKQLKMCKNIKLWQVQISWWWARR